MLRSTLECLGFTTSPYDLCVFSASAKAGTTVMTVHVDDVKIFAPTDSERERAITELSEMFPGLKINRGPTINYLGMKFEYRKDGTVNINMPGYTNALLERDDVPRVHATPAGEDLYQIDEDSKALNEEAAEDFHSTVCKLLYLGKMVRNELLGAVNFLCSKTQAPTEQDLTKLRKIFGYLRGKVDLGLTLGADRYLYVRLSVDASYGVYADGKSHTGACVFLGLGATNATSAMQKIVTKAST